MAIRDDSYGSVEEVEALTAYALRGMAGFNHSTHPEVTQVERFIDRASGVLNNALLGAGFAPPDIRANSTAKLACDDWVVSKAAAMVELTQPGAAFGEGDLSSHYGGLYGDACEFVKSAALGFKRAGVDASSATSEGLAFTGIKRHEDRPDPTRTTREQPLFRRHAFDNTRGAL